MKNYPIVFLISAFVFAISGCTGTPSRGDQMLAQSESTKDIALRWKSGTEMISDGEALRKKGIAIKEEGEEDIEDGEKSIGRGRTMVEEGEDRIAEGEDLIRRGNKLIEQSEAEYQIFFPDKVLD